MIQIALYVTEDKWIEPQTNSSVKPQSFPIGSLYALNDYEEQAQFVKEAAEFPKGLEYKIIDPPVNFETHEWNPKTLNFKSLVIKSLPDEITYKGQLYVKKAK